MWYLTVSIPGLCTLNYFLYLATFLPFIKKVTVFLCLFLFLSLFFLSFFCLSFIHSFMHSFLLSFFFLSFYVRKRAEIRNRYYQAPHLTQDTNGKVTTSQLDITIMRQEVSAFPAGDYKASTNRHALSITKQDRNNINDPHKKHRLGKVSKNNLTGELKLV